MPVKIRLTRMGKKKQPTYRVVVVDSRKPRDGAHIEQIGRYDPRQDPSIVEINNDRAVAWLQQGAQPSDRARKLLEISGAWARFRVARGEIHTIEEAPVPVPPPPKEEPPEVVIEEEPTAPEVVIEEEPTAPEMVIETEPAAPETAAGVEPAVAAPSEVEADEVDVSADNDVAVPENTVAEAPVETEAEQEQGETRAEEEPS
jgi:small subunit ribosomal protein S16